MFHWLKRGKDLKVVAIMNTARESWTFPDTLCPDVMLVDFWHSVQHLKAAAEADRRSGKWRQIFRPIPKGIIYPPKSRP